MREENKVEKILKEKLKKCIGKKITITKYCQKVNIDWRPKNDTREIWAIAMPPEEVLIVGFTHLCEGALEWGAGDSSRFTCTNKIPVIKVASGFSGKIMYVPMSELECV